MFFRPAVTPENICILRDRINCGVSIKPICLQILVLVLSPVVGLTFCNVVPLNEEEFGFASQCWASLSSKLLTDTVHRQARDAWISAQEVIWGTTTDDATDEGVTLRVLSLSDCLFDSWENLLPPQPLVDDYAEVKRHKSLFQQIWMRKEGICIFITVKGQNICSPKSDSTKFLTSIATHAVYDETPSSGVTGEPVGLQLILAERWENTTGSVRL